VLLRRLLPEPGEVETDDLPVTLALGEKAHETRPYVVANMVESADGRATVAGRSGPLGGDADRQLFHGLRTAVDAIFTGTGTLRAENYGRLVRNPERRERRVAAGLDPEPVAVVVSRRGRIPWSIPMFEEPEQRVLVFSETPVEAPAHVTAQVQVIHLADARPVAVLERLRADFGIRSVLSEGGPTLLSGLIADEVLDELFLTVAPVLAGESEKTVLDGPPIGEPAPLSTTWLLEHEGFLFLRYHVVTTGRV
jgi:riboflavin-specific deaminase-like protein